MNKLSSWFLLAVLVAVMIVPTYSQSSDGYTHKLKGGGTLKIKEVDLNEGAARSVKLATPARDGVKRPPGQKPVLTREEISELARKYGLSEWLDVRPLSSFTSHWLHQQPTEARLGIEFAALDVVLKVAKEQGLELETQEFYSAPQTILIMLQQRRASLEKVRLVDVPDLANLSRAEAENVLIEARLVPDYRPQYAPGASLNRVIPNSQDPQARLSVKPGTRVSFGVNIQDGPQISQASKTDLTVSLEFKAQDKVNFSKGGDAVYRASVKGRLTGLSTAGFGLLLWVRPVRPAADIPGWYLQRPPSTGIDLVAADGSWNGVVQLGSPHWPPHEGDTFDLAVSIADLETINKLMAQAGIVIRNQPIGFKVEAASKLIVSISRDEE